MTAAANTLGKNPDGSVRRYGLDPQAKVIHVLASKTGKVAHCGVTPKVQAGPATKFDAAKIERRTDPQVKGFSFCRACRAVLTPQPDPAIWGPQRGKTK